MIDGEKKIEKKKKVSKAEMLRAEETGLDQDTKWDVDEEPENVHGETVCKKILWLSEILSSLFYFVYIRKQIISRVNP